MRFRKLITKWNENRLDQARNRPESSILASSADFQEGGGTPHNRGAPMNLLNFAEALLVFPNIRILF
ncbi:hypothetical protein HFO96_02065 [Rhizobium leguminosarum]|nr:hypothetical protein [Rhizobium leguminosarum]